MGRLLQQVDISWIFHWSLWLGTTLSAAHIKYTGLQQVDSLWDLLIWVRMVCQVLWWNWMDYIEWYGFIMLTLSVNDISMDKLLVGGDVFRKYLSYWHILWFRLNYNRIIFLFKFIIGSSWWIWNTNDHQYRRYNHLLSVLLIVAWWCNMAMWIMVIIGSGTGLAPVWCQAITWTSADLMLIRLSGTNYSEIKIQNFSCKKLFV